MKYLLILLLVGCASNPLKFNNTEVVVQKEFIVRTAPDSMKTLPPLPATLPKPASNAQVATWVNNTERYVADVEEKVKALINYYEKPVK